MFVGLDRDCALHKHFWGMACGLVCCSSVGLRGDVADGGESEPWSAGGVVVVVVPPLFCVCRGGSGTR